MFLLFYRFDLLCSNFGGFAKVRLVVIAFNLRLSQLIGQVSDRDSTLCELYLCLFKLFAFSLEVFIQSFYPLITVSFDLFNRNDLSFVILTLSHCKFKLCLLFFDNTSLLLYSGFRLAVLLLVHLRLAQQALDLFLF